MFFMIEIVSPMIPTEKNNKKQKVKNKEIHKKL